jgi:phage terminase large subunit GpA-like protein
MQTFAEAELRLPDGKYKGLRFSVETQPYAQLWFQAHREATRRDCSRKDSRSGNDSGGLRIFILVGPTQSGKTLAGMIIPAMWHLFEHEETVCCLVPDESMVNDKWQKDFLPAIKASRYAKLLPTRGEGSRQGKVTDSVTFQNGATLKFLTGGGDDKSVAGYTSRVILATEINAFGKLSEASSESNRWDQAMARTRAYGEDAVVYGECTVDTESGLVWTEYMNGTGSRIAMPCGYCGDYVTLGRDNLVGWQQAKTIVQAEQLARWCCPACGVIWEPGDRELFARGSVLLHRGQEIVKAMDSGQLTMDSEERWTG